MSGPRLMRLARTRRLIRRALYAETYPSPCADELESVGFDQDSCIPRQTPRMTGNIHDSLGGPLCHTFHDCKGACRGGSSSTRSYGPAPRVRSRPLEEIIQVKFGVCDAVRAAFAAALATSARSPSTPTALPARRAIGRVKFPNPQNRSSTGQPPTLEQFHRRLDHRDVDLAIHLDEIGGAELEGHAAAVHV